MRKEMKNNIEMVSSSRNQVFSWTNAPRNHEITIGEKLLVSRGLMSLSLEEEVKVKKEMENNYYFKTLSL
jgi:hypothetical protein